MRLQFKYTDYKQEAIYLTIDLNDLTYSYNDYQKEQDTCIKIKHKKAFDHLKKSVIDSNLSRKEWWYMLTFSLSKEKVGYHELHEFISRACENGAYNANDAIYKQVAYIYFNNASFYQDSKITVYANYEYEQAYNFVKNNFYDITNVLRVAKSDGVINTIPDFLDVITIAETIVNVLVDYSLDFVVRQSELLEKESEWYIMLLTILKDEKEFEIEIDIYKLFYFEKVYVTEDVIYCVSKLLYNVYDYSNISDLTTSANEKEFDLFENTKYQTESAQIFIADNYDCIFKILDQNSVYDASCLDVVSIANLAINITLHKILPKFIDTILAYRF